MKPTILLYVFLFLAACKPSGNNKTELSADEYAVINTVLKTVIPVDTTFKASVIFLNSPPLFPPPYPPGYSVKKIRAEKLQWIRHADSIRKVLDTARFYVYISDSLFHFPGHYLVGIGKGTKEGLRADGFNHPDMVKQIALNADTNAKAIRFTRSLIKPVPHYTMVFYTGHMQLPKSRYTPGLYGMSRVCFNKGRTTACVYTNSYCGEKCGRGSLFFLTKKGLKWEIVDSCMLWIA